MEFYSQCLGFSVSSSANQYQILPLFLLNKNIAIISASGLEAILSNLLI